MSEGVFIWMNYSHNHKRVVYYFGSFNSKALRRLEPPARLSPHAYLVQPLKFLSLLLLNSRFLKQNFESIWCGIFVAKWRRHQSTCTKFHPTFAVAAWGSLSVWVLAAHKLPCWIATLKSLRGLQQLRLIRAHSDTALSFVETVLLASPRVELLHYSHLTIPLILYAARCVAFAHSIRCRTQECARCLSPFWLDLDAILSSVTQLEEDLSSFGSKVVRSIQF